MSADTVIVIRYSLQRESFALEIDTQIPMRGISGIYGASGAGKTTLLRCIAGLEKPSTGNLVVAGDVWEDGDTARAVIAHVNQTARDSRIR